MADSRMVITFTADVRPALHSIRVVREKWMRAMVSGWRWHDPDTGRFVRMVKHG